MKYHFTKMHGCGNDYIYFDCFDRGIDSPEALAVSLSDRHTGIGGDGIVLIQPSAAANAKMRMFNADGSEGAMCGNAIRCVAKHLYDSGKVRKRQMSIETKSGVKSVRVHAPNGEVSSAEVSMGRAELRPERIPVDLPGESVAARPIIVGGKEYSVTCVSMGNPHTVVFCENIALLNLPEIGPHFEHSPLFPDRTNTEFAEVLNKHELKMRVWERGSGETLACGTGACAAAVAAVLNGYCDKDTDIKVRMRGGELVIRYTDENVYMTGDCVKVFEGTVRL